MIKKLRVKFIAASMLALALVLLVILGGINVMSYRKPVSDADAILSVLASNQGMFPQRMSPAEDGASRKGAPGNSSMEDGVFRKRGFSDETPYEYRFIRSTEAGGIRIIFLDCGRSLFSFHAVLLASISIALLGLLAVLVLLILFSGRIVTPAAESSLFPVSRHKPNEYFVLCLHFPVRDPIMKATYLRRARGGIAMRSF